MSAHLDVVGCNRVAMGLLPDAAAALATPPRTALVSGEGGLR
jgi:hypothetical protein